MSKKLKTSAAKGDVRLDLASLDRPFDPVLWKRAERIAGKYRIVIWFEEGEWYGRGMELPLTMSDGLTPDECVANVREAMALTVASMLEDGRTAPNATSAGEKLRVGRSAARRHLTKM